MGPDWIFIRSYLMWLKQLNEIQKESITFLKDGGTIEEHELGEDYKADILRISLNEVGVCSKCRHQSGCYKCDQWKCLRYFMRQMHKRSGRAIEDQFQWAHQLCAEKSSNQQHGRAVMGDWEGVRLNDSFEIDEAWWETTGIGKKIENQEIEASKKWDFSRGGWLIR